MEIRYLVRRIWDEQPLRFGLSVAALAVAGLLEGFALASVVPLLQLVQGGGQTVTPTGRLGIMIGTVLRTLGLTLNLATLLVFIVLLVLTSQVIILMQARLVAGSAARFEARLRMRLYAAITEADWPFFVSHKSADLTTALMHETVRAGASYNTLVQMLGTVIMVFVYLVLALALSWQMTTIIAVTGALILFVLRNRVARGSRYGRAMTDMAFDMWSEAGEHIGASKTVKAYTVESQTIERYDVMTHEFTHLQYKNSMNQAWLKFFYESISMCAVFVGVYVAVTFFGMSIASLVVFLLVFYRVSPRISSVQSLQTQTLSLIPGLHEVDDLTREAAAAKEFTGSGPVHKLEKGIDYDGVGFSYREEADVLHDVRLSIPLGKTVAIVGPSGSGKTTMVDLLLGLIQPTSGRIVADGTPLSELDIRAWRNRIGYVAQDSSFFHDTVRENIRFGCRDATDEQIVHAAELAFADGFIGELPEGYDTIIGDRGVRLSGGQRQRLALARAIVRRPDILVLDEATSALDAESEQKIQQAVDRLAEQMTIVIVTHRLATVRNADTIFFLENGRVTESGTWEELVAKNGRFAEMQAKQSLS